MNFEQQRKSMVETQIKARGIKDKKVLQAMLKVPRHEFIPDKYRLEAYSDYPLPIGEGQTISQPYIVALMTELLELKGNEKVLEIGTGSGYQAAILAEITKEVISVERKTQLSLTAKSILFKYKNIRLIVGDGTKGYEKEAPYDAIIVAAAAEKIPETLKGQLKDKGIMVIPVGDFYSQRLLKLQKIKRKFIEQYVCDVRFVPLIED